MEMDGLAFIANKTVPVEGGTRLPLVAERMTTGVLLSFGVK